MIKSKWIDRICCVVLAVMLVVTMLFMNGEQLGVTAMSRALGYEERLFDQSRVHTIDIVADDWEGFLETCTDEEYILCDLVIDGESVQNVGLRAKGNTSLTSVASYGNDRYSFKIEVDHYDSTKSYHGLDKFCLNNIIQDNTYMKDYLVYTMMGDMGVASPLCSYAYITVNGEDWGLYLAVEAVEESFLTRNYGSDYGELYKPDSMSFGGGRGNGKDFDMEQFQQQNQENASEKGPSEQRPQDTGFSLEAIKTALEEQGIDTSSLPEDLNLDKTGPEALQNILSDLGVDMQTLMRALMDSGLFSQDRDEKGGRDGGNMEFGGGMGSSDTKLQYIDDNPESYSNIFNSAKTDVTEADQKRLIASLKGLSENEAIESVVNIETVIRYFVVHDFVQNGDSYTGSIIHNYYLYEKDGQMEMIPWDYNLAFGGFGDGGGFSAGFGSAGMTSTVNAPIDSPVSNGDVSDRPMVAWIFANEEYTELYHQMYQAFMTKWFDSGKCAQLINNTAALISSYVEKDPTAFCTYEEFQTGVQTLREFCLLRAESVQGQLDGTIPSTSAGQAADDSSLIDASSLNASDMGSQMMGGGHGDGRGEMPERPGRETDAEGMAGDKPESGDKGLPEDGKGMADAERDENRGSFGSKDHPGTSEDLPETPPAEEGEDQSAVRPTGGNDRGAAPVLAENLSESDTDGVPEQPVSPEGGFPGAKENEAGVSPERVMLASVSVILLLAGLIFVRLYRHRI